MFERFDDAARLALVLAQEEARGLGHDYIGCGHLLLGTLRVDDALAGVLPVERARAALVQVAPPGDFHSPAQIPFTAGAKRALEAALGGPAAELLRAKGIDEAAVWKLLG